MTTRAKFIICKYNNEYIVDTYEYNTNEECLVSHVNMVSNMTNKHKQCKLLAVGQISCDPFTFEFISEIPEKFRNKFMSLIIEDINKKRILNKLKNNQHTR